MKKKLRKLLYYKVGKPYSDITVSSNDYDLCVAIKKEWLKARKLKYETTN